MFAKVIINMNTKALDKIFHYEIPFEIRDEIFFGMRVVVPFGFSNKLTDAYIVGFIETTTIPNIKMIHSIKDEYPVFDENIIKIAEFMAQKYYTTLSDCLNCIIPKLFKDKIINYIYINYKLHNIKNILDEIIQKNTSQSKVILMISKSDIKYTKKDITTALKISDSPINTLLKKNILTFKEHNIKREVSKEYTYDRTYNLTLNKEQEIAYLSILNEIKNENRPNLLFGVTGSGKTEIYMQIIEKVINEGKEAIFLIPEISLAQQSVERIVGRFGNIVAISHSRLKDTDRFVNWKKAKDGEIKIMIGARSAIFTPFKKLGVIIIDEEHEKTYKSEISPKYDTREVAVEICKLQKASLILGSATPSIESYYNAKNNIYNLVNISNRAVGSLPSVEIIDMKKEFTFGNNTIFSNKLYDAIKENLKNNMQTILFLNRRGYSSFINCRACGYVMECDNCSINYTYHMKEHKLTCHYCGATKDIPKVCPNCNKNYIKYIGIGTEKVEHQVRKYFQNAKVLRMDIDTVTKRDSHEQIISKFKSGEADILIGTQMITKGLHFKNVSLVGVICADITLNIGSYKSPEDLFSLLVQVAGRAGRENNLGKVYIQTYQPEHYSIDLAKQNDYVKFYNTEIIKRKENEYPPFFSLFFIVIFSKNKEKAEKYINELYKVMLHFNKKTNFFLSDPVKANAYRLNNNFRYKIYLKAEEEQRLKNFVVYCVDIIKKNMKDNDVYFSLVLNPSYIP